MFGSKIVISFTQAGEATETKSFRKLEKAQAYAQSLMGETPELVSDGAAQYGDGSPVLNVAKSEDGTMTVEGLAIEELFPALSAEPEKPELETQQTEMQSEAVSEQPQPETEQAESQTEQAKPVELVTLVLPADTKETAQYLITPEMGGRPRWFEKARLSGYGRFDGGWEVTLPKRAVKDRGLLAAVKQAASQ